MMNRRERNHASFTVLFERVRKIKSREREREIFGLKRYKTRYFCRCVFALNQIKQEFFRMKTKFETMIQVEFHFPSFYLTHPRLDN